MQLTFRKDWKWRLWPSKPLSPTHNMLQRTTKKNAPSTARKEGKISSCKRATEARVRPKLKDSAATMNNPINSHSGKMCSCGKMCKNNRDLKIHQEKTKCQTPENKFVAPPQKCFVSLQNVILSSCLTFDDGVYYRTSDNTFIPISNSEKPVAGNKCYVQTKDIVIHPLTECLSNDINQCGVTSCHTCNFSLMINLSKVIWLVKNTRPLVMIDFHVAPQM